MASTPPLQAQVNAPDHSNGGDVHPFEELTQDHIQPRRPVTFSASFGLYVLDVCFTVIYIFMTSQETQPGWFKIARMVITGLFLANSAILSCLNPEYLLQHILPISGIFSIIAITLYYLIGGGVLTDGIGVVMASLAISAISPKLKGDVTALLESPEPILPIQG